jgi:retron-type reverse transcriptase
MYESIYSWKNLLDAYRKASKGKRGKANVAEFEYFLEKNLISIQRELREKTYMPGQYTSFFIHEPKQRLISAAPFRDRVVHHALCNVIEPMFESVFIYDSYANRKKKGTHKARLRAQYFVRHYMFFLQLDIIKFFPSIDHKILHDNLARKISSADVMWLIDMILASSRDLNESNKDDLLITSNHSGLPIGNLTSQFWANVYLNPFDHFVKRELRCKAYLRYVDDFLLFSNDKKTLWEWKNAIIERLAMFKLTIHSGAQPRPVTEGIPFLGFIIYPDKCRLKNRKGIHFRRRLSQMMKDYNTGHIEFEKIEASVRGWINHVRYGNTISLRRKTLEKYFKFKIKLLQAHKLS